MVARTDFIPALNGQHKIHPSRYFSTVIPRQPALRFVSNVGVALITFFIVFSGFHDSQENLEKMGVSLGPNHL